MNTGNVALVIDHHEIPRQGFVDLLDRHPLFGRVIACGSEAEALQAAAREHPALIVVVLRPLGEITASLIGQLVSQNSQSRILIVSALDERLITAQSLRLGAHGIINENAPCSLFLAAIDRVLGGEFFLTPRIVDLLFGSSGAPKTEDPVDSLSDREFQIFSLLARGLTAKAIGRELGLSSKTVEYHRQKIKGKLQIHSTADLIRFATLRSLHGERGTSHLSASVAAPTSRLRTAS